MTQEEKKLLLKDLCGRLPYGVICKSPTGYKFTLHQMNPNELTPFGKGVVFDFGKTYYIGDIKPYLRPMSSMTEEERKEYHKLCNIDEEYGVGGNPVIIAKHDTPESLDYLNSIHVDYRMLIPRGLAISTEVFNPYKD